MAADLKDLADTVTGTVVAAFTLLAVLVVAVGAWKAVRDRRRQQLVIADVPQQAGRLTPQELDAASLSPLLRQQVLRRLVDEQRNADWIVTLLSADSRQGLLPFGMALEVAEQTVSAAAGDTLATFSKGLKAVAPTQADGFIGALGSALPPPRGYVVRAYPLTRGSTRSIRLGLALELSRLDGPPIATTTLWEPAAEAPDGGCPDDGCPNDACPNDAYQERFIELLDVATRWIAVRLIAERLYTTRVWGRRQRTAGWVGKERGRRRVGMRRLFAGALALTAMKECRQHALAFGTEAVDDLRTAADRLKSYHRPWVVLGGVQEQLAFAHRRDGAATKAHRLFAEAAGSWRRAHELLTAFPRPSSSSTSEELDDTLEQLRVRRLKCLLLSADALAGGRVAGEVTAELKQTPLSARSRPRTLFSAACLYAHISALLGPDYLALAWRMLGRALLSAHDDDRLWELALTDEELEPLAGRARFVDRLRPHRPASARTLEEAEADRLIGLALAALTENAKEPSGVA